MPLLSLGARRRAKHRRTSAGLRHCASAFVFARVLDGRFATAATVYSVAHVVEGIDQRDKCAEEGSTSRRDPRCADENDDNVTAVRQHEREQNTLLLKLQVASLRLASAVAKSVVASIRLSRIRLYHPALPSPPCHAETFRQCARPPTALRLATREGRCRSQDEVSQRRKKRLVPESVAQIGDQSLLSATSSAEDVGANCIESC